MGRSSLPSIQRRASNKQIKKRKMSVSFKVTLSQGEEQETRRFLVGQEVASSLIYLKQKIATIFPAFRRSEPVLSWVDEDGDEVVVASDEELEVALAALPGPVYKFRVRLADTRRDENHPGMACPKSGALHLGIICDGCDGPVLGPRYKCLTCPDFDLCGSCEARGLHVQHKMIRLDAPCKRVSVGPPRCQLVRTNNMQRGPLPAFTPNSMLGNPNVHMLAGLLGGKPWVSGCQSKTARPATKKPAEKSEPTPKPEPTKKPEAAKKPEAVKNPEAKKPECGEPSQSPKPSTPMTPNGLPGVLADLTPLLGPVQSEQLSQFLGSILGSQQHQEAEAEQKKSEQQLQEHLGQLGGLISTFIGPAAVEAAFPLLEALAKAGQTQAQEENQSTQEPASKEEETVQKKNTDIEPEKEKSPEKQTETTDESKEDSDFEVIPETSSKTNISPTLPTEEQNRLWKTNPRESTGNEKEDGNQADEDDKTESKTYDSEENPDANGHDNDKVTAALKTMKAMGFSDDGGWLSNLLKAKSGDVGEVLDTIQPVKN